MAFYNYQYYNAPYVYSRSRPAFERQDEVAYQDRIFIGERVVELYGARVGHVSDIYNFGFRVERPFAEDITLPYSAILDAAGDRIELNLPADRLDATYGAYSRGRYQSSSNAFGRHTGHGPRGYRRSDERICEDVNDRLWMEGQLDATDIAVQADDGIVTLNGFVDSRWAKRRAEDLAWQVPGVLDVINRLRTFRGTWQNWRTEMHPGMDIVGSLGGKLGTLGQVRDYDFLLERKEEPGLWIPFDAIQDVRNGRIILNLTLEEVNGQDWVTTDTRPA